MIPLPRVAALPDASGSAAFERLAGDELEALANHLAAGGAQIALLLVATLPDGGDTLVLTQCEGHTRPFLLGAAAMLEERARRLRQIAG